MYFYNDGGLLKKKIASKYVAMKNLFFSVLTIWIVGLLPLQAQIPATTAKMNAFVSGLMSRMTLEEKIGQLNLLTPGGGVATGAVVSSDVETKISKGQVGGLFGVIGVEKIRKAQNLAISRSRLKIPLIFGSDVIHGYKTTFPIPLGLSCSRDMEMIEHSARIAATEASVVTDYTAINEMVTHGFGNLQTVSALALNAGVDMDMVGEGFLTTLPTSLQQHKVTLRQIDDACRRILKAKYKLGLF